MTLKLFFKSTFLPAVELMLYVHELAADLSVECALNRDLQ